MRLSWGRRIAGVVATVALVLLAWSGAALTWRYRPDAGGPSFGLPASVRWSRRLEGWHGMSLLSALVALVAWCGLTAADRTWPQRRPGAFVACLLVAAAWVVSAAAAWERARWNQIGLWAVSTGGDIGGLWYAAFSDDVRVVFVDGSGEQPPSALAPWVVLYLVAPFAALVTLALGWLSVRPISGPRRSIVAPAGEPAGTAGHT